MFEEICLELNKQQPPKKTGQGRPATPSTAAQQKQPGKQVGQGSSRTPTTAAQTKVSNKPPAAPAANLPPVKSKTIQEKVRLAEEERRKTIAARSKTPKFVPPVPNTSAEAFMFVSSSNVYSTPQQQTMTTSQSTSSMPSQNLETVFEDQEMTQLSQDQEMSQPGQTEMLGDESQQLEGGQYGTQLEGTADQFDRESQGTTSINPSVVSELPHLGSADPRTLSNVLESQIERSDGGSEAGSAASSRKRVRTEQQPTRTSTRERNPPQFLNPIVTHQIEENQAGQAPSAELTTVMTALQNNPSAGGTNPYNPTQFVNQFGQYYQGQQFYPAISSSSIPHNDPNFLHSIGLGYPVSTMQMPRLQEEVVMRQNLSFNLINKTYLFKF